MSAIQRTIVSSYFTIFTSNGISQTKKLSLIKRRRNARMRRILAVLAVVMSSAIVELIYGRHERTIWMNPRSSHWWEDVVLRSFGVRDWLENFRVSQETFHYLCQQLKPLIEKQSTVMRRPISVERPCSHNTVDIGYTFQVSQCSPLIWNSKMYSLHYHQGNL